MEQLRSSFRTYGQVAREGFQRRLSLVRELAQTADGNQTYFANKHIDEPNQVYLETAGHHPLVRFEINSHHELLRAEYLSTLTQTAVREYIAAQGVSIPRSATFTPIAEVSEKVFESSEDEPFIPNWQIMIALLTGRDPRSPRAETTQDWNA